MTIYELQQRVAARVKNIFMHYTPPPGMDPVQVFVQNIPPKKTADDASQVPACIIKLGDGQDDGTISTQDVTIIVGVKDNNEDFSGYQTICSMIEKIRLNVSEKPIVGGMYEIVKPIKWKIEGEEETYPFYWGAIILKFELPIIQRGYNSYT